jgi:hypothetical protein
MENLPSFFKRRFDHHKFEKTMRKNIDYAFGLSKSFDDFETRLISLSLVKYFSDRHDITIATVSGKDLLKITQYLSDVYEPLIKLYYRSAKKR